MAAPTVSVVVATIGRTELARAVESVLSQTHEEIELILVVDDPARHTTIKETFDDPRVVVLGTAGGQGGAVARNLGLRAATGDFVAYLDDDDWWDHRKLEQQLRLLAESPEESFCWTYTRFWTADGEHRVIPRWPLDEHDRIADYLVSRSRLTHGDGYIQTSSLLLTAELAAATPWDESLGKHQDWDLVLRLVQGSGGTGACIALPLANVQQGSGRSVSRSVDLASSAAWLERHADRLSPRARADFVCVHLLRPALRDGSPGDAWRLWRRYGSARPHPAAIVVAAAGIAERLRTRRTEPTTRGRR